MNKDVRVLCASCLSEYQRAGYRLKLVWSDKKEPCDRCRVKYGWTYILEPTLFEINDNKKR